MFLLQLDPTVNTVGSSSPHCKISSCTEQFLDKARSFGLYFPKLIKSRRKLESIYLAI